MPRRIWFPRVPPHVGQFDVLVPRNEDAITADLNVSIVGDYKPTKFGFGGSED